MADVQDTLYTFVVDFGRPASFVNILGSWDNFQHAYPLKKEVRGSRETWRRYADFEKVICDGDRLRRPNEGRDGSLKMGGTYWYYYQIDNDGEFCDPSEPTTRSCPFLPGQEVNILEVPSIAVEPWAQSDSPVSASVYTLDPQEKYRMVPGRGKAPVSVQHGSPPPAAMNNFVGDGSTPAGSSVAGPYSVSDAPPSPSISKQSQRSISVGSKRRHLSAWGPSSGQRAARRRLLQGRPSTMPSSSQPSRDADFLRREVHTSSTTGVREEDNRPRSSWHRLARVTSALSHKLSVRSVSSILPWRPESRWRRSAHSAAAVEQLPTDDLLSPRSPSPQPDPPMPLEFHGERGTDWTASTFDTGLVSRSASQLKSQRGSLQRQGNVVPRLVHSNTTSTRSSTFSPLIGPSDEKALAAARRSPPGTPDSGDLFSFRPFERGNERRASPSLSLRSSDHERCSSSKGSNGRDDGGVVKKTPGLGYGHGRGHGSGSVLSLHDVDRLLNNSISTSARGSPHGGVEDCRSDVTDIEALCRDMGYLGSVITSAAPEWDA